MRVCITLSRGLCALLCWSEVASMRDEGGRGPLQPSPSERTRSLGCLCRVCCRSKRSNPRPWLWAALLHCTPQTYAQIPRDSQVTTSVGLKLMGPQEVRFQPRGVLCCYESPQVWLCRLFAGPSCRNPSKIHLRDSGDFSLRELVMGLHGPVPSPRFWAQILWVECALCACIRYARARLSSASMIHDDNHSSNFEQTDAHLRTQQTPFHGKGVNSRASA